jgi:polyketide biosynthesis enoyl-CoA hydratase PksH
MMTEPRTLQVAPQGRVLSVVLNRPERQNALNAAMIAELHAVLDAAEADPDIRVVALAAAGPDFCAGMDFAEASSAAPADAAATQAIAAFYRLMERFTLTPKVVVANVSGRVTAGGVGLVAAADFVIATPAASFQLSEVLFGLLPATVAPFVIRRCGFQPAYRLSLTAQRIDAKRALELGLVDELGEDGAKALRELVMRIGRVREACVGDLKRYFRELWIIGQGTETAAVDTISRLISDPATIDGIRRFVQEASPIWRR